MQYEAKEFTDLLGTAGFSDKLLTTHFGLYEGYVKNTNAIAATLYNKAHEGQMEGPEYAELKRRFGWEFNGMRLHELYFGGMTKEAGEPDLHSKFAEKVKEAYGSWENWATDFKSTGAMRGIGWVVCSLDPSSSNVFNTWIDEHDDGHFANTLPLLVMDVFEHAFIMDYDMNRAEYITAFWKAVDWKKLQTQYEMVAGTLA